MNARVNSGKRRGSNKKRKKEAPRSTLAMRIVRAAVDPDVAVAELAEMAQADAAFAMRMLGVVNSAAFGLTTKVTDIPRAASMLGLSGLRNLALSLSLSQMVPMGDDGAALLAACLRRGIAARVLANKMGIVERSDDYFTVGLLLESGILAEATDDLAGAAQLVRSPALARTVQERCAGNVPHPERGARLAEKWSLGEEMEAAIRHHHDPEPPEEQLARVAWVAERIAAVFEGGDVAGAIAAAMEAGAALGVNAAGIDELLSELPAMVTDTAKGFERDVGEQPDVEQLANDAAAQLVELNKSFHTMVLRLERMLAEKEALATALQEANDRLKQMAAMDGLTGLANHRTFQDSLGRDLSRAARNGTRLSLVMIDVDHFKKFNDAFGHPAGDAVLRALSKLLKASVRDGDIPARYGGEEFAVILPETDEEQAALVAERLRSNLERMKIKLGGKPVKVTASFGVSTVTGAGCDKKGNALIAAADRALYDAKRGGRNCVRAVEI